MKKLFTFSLLAFTTLAYSQDVKLKNFDWTVTDIKSRGLNSKSLFDKLDRKFINLKSSICSNRAHMWAYDLEGKHNIDTAKIFLFYTKESGVNETSLRGWWYHVAPVVSDKGVLTVLDGGFPGFIKSPLTTNEWMEKFSRHPRCKEIQPHETELIERMFVGALYPDVTPYGVHKCYYMITPSPYWTPATIATEILGRDENGRPARIDRTEINLGELEFACMEATTTKLGRIFGGISAKEKCEEFISKY
ncbi:MAG TPA: protein-glutamine glutaminase family protein [Bacteriovoracaceae bacterium]|nr:protein-glutamine glutaminase family protein [Bacteriovoracaceae bacterium]